MFLYKGAVLDFRHLKLFLALLFMRFLHLWVVKSYYVPDEYWQSLEIAHKAVFGYGYVTWEWKKAIRSFFYPFWISILFKIADVLKLDYVDVLILLPRILQTSLSAVADLFLWCWLNKPVVKVEQKQLHWIYLMWTTCLMVNYCATRTLTNTAELDFSIIAMYYFPWDVKQSCHGIHFLWFVGFACLVRPTAVIQWLPLCLYDIFSNPKPFNYLFNTYISIMCKIVCLSIAVDFLFYRKIVLTPINFVLYNGQYNVGIHYGVHSWFWYIIIGIPVVLGPVFILFYYSIFKISRNLFIKFFRNNIKCDKVYHKRVSVVEFLLLVTIVWTVGLYSLIPHKEFRFILPLTPAMIYLAGVNTNFNWPKKQVLYIKHYILISISICAIIFNIFGLLYLGQWHQVGPMAVMSKLAQFANENSIIEPNFLFLTPCHSTPFYSHMHVNVTARFLTCEPNLQFEEFYKDESDVFFENPILWLEEYALTKNNCSLPSHIIFFSNLKLSIEKFLNYYNYTQAEVIFHSHFSQGRQSQYIEIFHLVKPESCYTGI